MASRAQAADLEVMREVGRMGVEYRAGGDLKLARRDNGPGNKATFTRG